MENKICIVVIGYNRENSLLRCLDRLNECYYDRDVDLYISIDNSNVNQKTTKIAQKFTWHHGIKHVILHEDRLGLKKHVLECGNIVNKKDYFGIIMLEDDIYVAKDFYNYTSQCLKKYASNDKVAGISLYKHDWNIDAKLPFYPIYEGNDVFFIQYAQSWGQAWTKRMWNNFYEWYLENSNWDKNCDNLPVNVLNWSDKSWLKYFIKYCANLSKYFVYPFQSLSTNFSDIGEHNKISNLSMHRSLSTAVNVKYKLPELDNSISKYDCFFENIYLKEFLNIDDMTVNLYGRKNNTQRYLLTTKKMNYKSIKEYGLHLKPIELNIIENIPGNNIFLYDTSKSIKKNLRKNKLTLINYYWYDFDLKNSISYLILKITIKIKNLLTQ